jgi:hypothetical protein
MLARQGHPDKAAAAYRAFLNEHPYAAERQQAMEALAQMGFAPDPSSTFHPLPQPVSPASPQNH